MNNVIKLAHSGQPCKKACTDCRHFHPVTEWPHGWVYSHTKLLWLFGVGTRKPTADGIHFAKCSAFGGDYASSVRSTVCNGDFWETEE